MTKTPKKCRHRSTASSPKERCRHVLRMGGVRVEFTPGVESPAIDRDRRTCEPIIVLVDARQCLACDAWLSLGPSDETDPRVAVEIRAAEIASAPDDEALMNNDEAYGYALARNPNAALFLDYVFDHRKNIEHEQMAGALAYEIVSNPVE